jgi:hypothetical protein
MFRLVRSWLTERKTATYKKYVRNEPDLSVTLCFTVHKFPISLSPSAALSSVGFLSGVFGRSLKNSGLEWLAQISSFTLHFKIASELSVHPSYQNICRLSLFGFAISWKFSAIDKYCTRPFSFHVWF